MPNDNPAKMLSSLASSLGLSSSNRSTSGGSQQTQSVTNNDGTQSPVNPPLLYIQCRLRDEKIAWLHSEYGQTVLKQRPVLHEYYHNGYIFQIIDNPHWKVRLEDWLTLPIEESNSSKVPYGLSLPKTEEEKLVERDNWLHSPCENPPLQEIFGEYFELYKSSPEYYLMPLENRLQILTDGFTILRNIVPIDIVENAERTIAGVAAEADVETLEKLGLAKELIYENYRIGGTVVHSVKKGDKGVKTFTETEGEDFSSSTKDNDSKSGKFSNIFKWSSSANANNKAVAAPIYERKVNDLPRDPFFLSGTTNELPVLALYYASRVHVLLEYLLHGEHALHAPFRQAVGGGQIAYRFSQPLSAAQYQSSAFRKIGGSSWHIDGLQNGDYGSFSFLVGFPLNEQQDLYAGNLCLHAGSHYSLQPWLQQYARQSQIYSVSETAAQTLSSSFTSSRTAVAAAGSQRHLLTPAQRQEEDERLAGRRELAKHSNKPILDEPVQIQVSPGDVVIAMHKVAHLGGPNFHSRNVRKMVYFRVSHRQHSTLRYTALEEGKIWIEYEGLHDLL